MRRSVVVVVLLALASAGLPVLPADAGRAGTNPCVGRIASPAEGMTVISVQGAKGGQKTSARLVGVGPRGEIRWVHRLGPEKHVVWSYDVDPLPNGNLFGTATRRNATLGGYTVFFELNPRTGEWVWSEEVDLLDTHDADLLGRHRILIANMRNYDESSGKNDDRILIYNRTSDEVVWEWLFREHGYEPSVGGNYSEDWTHVNDVDRIAKGRFLVSPRNFDQTIVVDRSSGEVVSSLGADDRHRVMDEQHNPQYLESEEGNPTILVADSGNDRIVEYERSGGDWERTWKLGSSKTLSWPRDADRLPSGNTLVVDSRGQRVIEVSPTGDVVWEFYSPWLVYDAERVRLGDEAGGPTIADQGKTGSYAISKTARPRSELESCAERLRTVENPWGGNATPTWDLTPVATPTPTPTDDRVDGTPDGPAVTATPTTVTDAPGQPGFGFPVVPLALGVVLLFGWRRTR